MSEYKKLYRSKDKKLCGVCGGFADYFEIDPTLIRLLWIIFGLMSCVIGVIAYLVCALVMPEQP